MIDILWTWMIVLLLLGANIILLAVVIGGSLMILSLFAMWFTQTQERVAKEKKIKQIADEMEDKP